ncbi:hypothetical protein [Flavobacterium sp. MK4S-17]|uniref:hypothetical protein n=1 Tax=Flavobacterium sp. MK4S-17 TaxID=2543737 RepID=UPI00135BA5CC|nr:hypothetical protein [Flavobacterium sp. MK4S-17]
MSFNSLYSNYDLLLPPKFDGGYLVIGLYERIKSGEISDYFTHTEIGQILKQISFDYEQPLRQWSTIKDNLFYYFIRNDPEEPWKYYLTDYAFSVVELMYAKLNNPFKTHALRASMEEAFTLEADSIETVEELERRFGRIFVQGSKKIIVDHLEALEEELGEAYKKLNDLLRFEESDAVATVKEFAAVFETFGERAEDITAATISKDQFLMNLRQLVDHFYTRTSIDSNVADWERAQDIYKDLRTFFSSVDKKVSLIRKQINHASEKLTELQEQFSARANFRLKIRMLYKLALTNADFSKEGIVFQNGFPTKSYVDESTKIVYPKHFDFDNDRSSRIVEIEKDDEYEQEMKATIFEDVRRQEIMEKWIFRAKDLLMRTGKIAVNDFFEEILGEETFDVAYQIVGEVVAMASQEREIYIDIDTELRKIKSHNIALWKMDIRK